MSPTPSPAVPGKKEFPASPRVLVVFADDSHEVCRLDFALEGGRRDWGMRYYRSHYTTFPSVANYDAVVFAGEHPAMQAWAREAGLPMVAAFSVRPVKGIPTVGIDYREVGRRGAEYLTRELGCRHVCLISGSCEGPEAWEAAQWEGFAEQARRAGREPMHWIFSAVRTDAPVKDRSWREGWLAAQLRDHAARGPLGVMLSHDVNAPEVVRAARMAGLGVPENVLVLAPDGCQEQIADSPVPLSFISDTTPRICRQTMDWVADLLAGRELAADQSILVAPGQVHERASTLGFVCELPGMADAVVAMRTRFRQRILASALAKEHGMSLRTLQREIKRALGRTFVEELFRLRLEYAEQLLKDTDMKLSAVAVESGFGSHRSLIEAFQRTHGMPPSEWRELGRSRDAGRRVS